MGTIKKDTPPLSKYILKDSGKRQEFESGVVRDSREDKGRYDLITPIGLARLALVYERGAKKYCDRNWEKGAPMSRYLDSAMRHTLQYIEGYRDEDHLAQAAWNLMAAIHTEEMVKRGVLPEKLNDMPEYLPCKIETEKEKE